MGTSTRDIGPNEAAAAIARVERSRDGLASRVIAPPWFHPALGLCAGGLLAVAETRDWPLFYVAVAVYTVTVAALTWVNQRRAGVWLQSRRGRPAQVVLLQDIAIALLAGTACWLEFGHNVRGAFVIAGLIAVPMLILFGLWCDHALRADILKAR